LRKQYPQYFYARQDRIYEYSSVPRLLGAYGFFYERIRHAVETDDLDDEFTEAPEVPDSLPGADRAIELPKELKLDAIWESLVEEFKVVEIVLEEGDDAQVIFETLNERGEPLLAADLVRNNIFQRADAAKEKAESLFAKHWALFERPFWSVPEKQGRYKKPRIEFFLSHYISGNIAGEVNLSKLFSEYKAFVKRRKYSNVASEIEELHRYGEIYLELIERSAATELVAFSRRLLPWDVTTIFPLVLRIWASLDMSVVEKAACLRTLLAFVVRRAICGLTTKNYNKLFLSAVAHLETNGWTEPELNRFVLAQTADSNRFPRDDEFRRKWMDFPIYSVLQPAKVRVVLEELELSRRNKFHETTSLVGGLTVEHVLPQSWSAAWPLQDGSSVSSSEMTAALYVVGEDDSRIGKIARRNRLKESIGNLTLLTQPLNSTVSNGPFATKRIALNDHSLLVLNREITSHETWDEDGIVKRSADLFESALKLWMLPNIEM
jgi:hypothetical protein